MGKIKNKCQDFLENGGSELGYSMECLPELSEFQIIINRQIDAQDYSESQEKEKEHGRKLD